MINWDSKIEHEWDLALVKYNDYLNTSEKSSRDVRITITNANTISSFTSNEFFHYLHDEFIVWKYTACNRLATAMKSFNRMKVNDLSVLKSKLTNSSLSDEVLLDTAMKIRGLGCVGATALLSTLYPNRFSAIDQFIIKNLQHADSLSNDAVINEINPNHIKKSEAVYVLKIIQQKAKELNNLFGKISWTPRTVDKAIWADR